MDAKLPSVGVETKPWWWIYSSLRSILSSGPSEWLHFSSQCTLGQPWIGCGNQNFIASFPGLPPFYLLFVSTIIHGSRRPAKKNNEEGLGAFIAWIWREVDVGGRSSAAKTTHCESSVLSVLPQVWAPDLVWLSSWLVRNSISSLARLYFNIAPPPPPPYVHPRIYSCDECSWPLPIFCFAYNWRGGNLLCWVARLIGFPSVSNCRCCLQTYRYKV